MRKTKESNEQEYSKVPCFACFALKISKSSAEQQYENILAEIAKKIRISAENGQIYCNYSIERDEYKPILKEMLFAYLKDKGYKVQFYSDKDLVVINIKWSALL